MQWVSSPMKASHSYELFKSLGVGCDSKQPYKKPSFLEGFGRLPTCFVMAEEVVVHLALRVFGFNGNVPDE